MNKISLKQILQSLYDNAEKYPETSSSCTLSKGLRITLKIREGIIRLYISRTDTYPSLQEFNTVLKSLPYAPQILPKSIDSKDISPLREHRFYLVAKWPKQEAIPMEAL